MDNLQHPAASPTDAELVRGQHTLGNFEITICSDGTFLLDGGAMFGVVPKTLWSKRAFADADNRILVGCNTVIVRTGEATVLIETGIGNKQPAKMREIFRNQELLMESLAAADVRVDDVTHVINTHLHFDHAGWNTTLRSDGSVVPTFPNARYFAAAGELAHGRLQLDRDKVSYLGPNYDPVIAAGQMTLIDLDGVGGFAPDDARLAALAPLPPVTIQQTPEVVPGIWVETFAGHTETMLGVHIESGGQHACYTGDLFPTHHHLDPTWVMGYDLDPVTCIANRKKFLQRAIDGDWLVLFTHDHQLPAAKLMWNEKGKPVVR
jgi:glyoxylase-like metal-dependent hydrolase (beta-lactamase superfamily II)